MVLTKEHKSSTLIVSFGSSVFAVSWTWKGEFLNLVVYYVCLFFFRAIVSKFLLCLGCGKGDPPYVIFLV